MRLWAYLRSVVDHFLAINAPSRGAAIAFYTVTAIAPLLIIAIAIGGSVFGTAAAQRAIISELRQVMGSGGADFLKAILESSAKSRASWIAALVSGLTLLIAASGAFVELQDALNAVWQTKPSRADSLRSFLVARFISIGLSAALGFFLLVSLVLDAGLTALYARWNGGLTTGSAVLAAVDLALSFVTVTAIFAAIYKYVPNRIVRWKDVIPAAAVTSVLFQFGKFAIGFYLGTSGIQSSIGASGALLGLLLWVYYSAQVFLLGASATEVYQCLRKRAERAEPLAVS
jgi:membrane protein